MSDQAVNEKDVSLVSQCLAFCQTLVSQGRAVNLSLKICSSFIFSQDTKDNEKVPAAKAKKKVSPSTQRRNQRRRKEFLASKEALSSQKTSLNREIHDTFPLSFTFPVLFLLLSISLHTFSNTSITKKVWPNFSWFCMLLCTSVYLFVCVQDLSAFVAFICFLSLFDVFGSRVITRRGRPR